MPRRRDPPLREALERSVLAKGKTVTGFANVEEDFADNAVWEMKMLSREKHVMPWRIEDEMRKIGANYVQAGLWRGFAVRDGNLITGPVGKTSALSTFADDGSGLSPHVPGGGLR
jgi:putative intracellular protease/amidase